MVVDRAKVEKQAKEILDKFASALAKIEKEEEVEAWVDMEEFERMEVSSGSEDPEASRIAAGADANFKKKMLANAPNHDEDFVVGERGGWK